MPLPAPDPAATVVVTGASSGIGAELARELARRGHGVTLVARRRELLDALAQELRDGHGVAAEVVAADLGTAEGRDALVAEVTKPVAGLANNAGFGSFGFFPRLDQAHERQEVQVNVVALHHLTGAFLPAMVERGRGAVLNVGSIAGAQPLPRNTTYAATKAFVNSFSEALHAELRGTGVSCTLVTPGPVKTEFADRAGVGDLEASTGRAPLLWLTAEEVARQAVDGMVKGRRVVVPGVVPKLATTGGRFSPRTVLLPVVNAALARRD